GIGYLGLQSRVLEEDRALEQSRRGLDGQQRLEPGNGRERNRKNALVPRSLGGRQPRAGVLERLLGGALNDEDLTDVALDLRDTGVVALGVDESARRELEGPLEALLRAREQQQRVRSRAAGR